MTSARARSRRFSVTVNRKRSAETVLLIVAGTYAVLVLMQLEASYVLDRGGVRGAPKET